MQTGLCKDSVFRIGGCGHLKFSSKPVWFNRWTNRDRSAGKHSPVKGSGQQLLLGKSCLSHHLVQNTGVHGWYKNICEIKFFRFLKLTWNARRQCKYIQVEMCLHSWDYGSLVSLHCWTFIVSAILSRFKVKYKSLGF